MTVFQSSPGMYGDVAHGPNTAACGKTQSNSLHYLDIIINMTLYKVLLFHTQYEENKSQTNVSFGVSHTYSTISFTIQTPKYKKDK
jgi:hypothetical protein